MTPVPEWDRPSTWSRKWRRRFVCTLPLSAILLGLAIVLFWTALVLSLPTVALVKWGSDLWFDGDRP